jgi:hypothetical protein
VQSKKQFVFSALGNQANIDRRHSFMAAKINRFYHPCSKENIVQDLKRIEVFPFTEDPINASVFSIHVVRYLAMGFEWQKGNLQKEFNPNGFRLYMMQIQLEKTFTKGDCQKRMKTLDIQYHPAHTEEVVKGTPLVTAVEVQKKPKKRAPSLDLTGNVTDMDEPTSEGKS